MKHTTCIKQIIMPIVTLLALCLPGIAMAGMSTPYAEIPLNDISLGVTYTSDGTNIVYYPLKNTGLNPINITSMLYSPEQSECKAGYEPLPANSPFPSSNIDIMSIDPTSFDNVAGGATVQISLTIDIPDDTQYEFKKYQANIYSYCQDAFNPSVYAGVITKVLISTTDATPLPPEPGAITISSNSAYPALDAIGMTGNKAKIGVDVSSPEEITSVTLHYRKKGNATFTAKNFDKSPASQKEYQSTVEIPADFIESSLASSGFEYYIKVKTLYQTEGFLPSGAPTTPRVVDVSRITTKDINNLGGPIDVYDGNPDDGATGLNIPAGTVSTSTTFSIEQKGVTGYPAGRGNAVIQTPVAVYELGPDGIQFNGQAVLSLLYVDLDNDDKVEDPDNPGIKYDAADLRIFYLDSTQWKVVPGAQTYNSVNNTITANISHLSTYALFPYRALAAHEYRPDEKIITPAMVDDYNDVADFHNLPSEIKIFDVTGRKIRTISAGTAVWNGKDDDGEVVESGVYIYQFKYEGKLISGMITVAK